MSNVNSNGIFTPEELAERDIIKNTRFKIISMMTESGTTAPDSVGEIRVLNEVMAAADKTIVDTANIRLKQEDVANNGAAVEMVTEMLRQSKSKTQHLVRIEDIPTLPTDLTNVDLVEGETSLNPERLVPEDFVTPKFDATKVDT